MRLLFAIRGLLLAWLILSQAACSATPMPPDSPAARYDQGGAATVTGAYDFGLF